MEPVPCCVPPRASVRDLLSDLLGHAVTVDDGDAQELDRAHPARAATYVRDDGSVAAVALCDGNLVLATGAAIGQITADAAQPMLTETGPDDDLLELFHEVVNVLAKLLNSPTTPHVALHDTRAVPGTVPPAVAEAITAPRTRVDFSVEVSGFPPGTLTLVTR